MRKSTIPALSRKGVAYLDRQDKYGRTPLGNAVLYRDLQAATQLLLCGADTEARTSSDGLTALMLAGVNADLRMAKLLLASGASLAAENDYNSNAAEIVSDQAHVYAKSADEKKTYVEILAVMKEASWPAETGFHENHHKEDARAAKEQLSSVTAELSALRSRLVPQPQPEPGQVGAMVILFITVITVSSGLMVFWRHSHIGRPAEVPVKTSTAARDEAPQSALWDPPQTEDYDTINVLMMKEREANNKLVKNRSAALKARAEGFPIPVRRVGDLECETLKHKLHESVPVGGDMGRSKLQVLITSTWHPMKVVVTAGGEPKSVVNADDPMMLKIEQAYPGMGVADFILARWNDLQTFNPSGGYCVEIPWNVNQERELTPEELMTIMIQGKGKRKKNKRGVGQHRR
jgi:hypothetical protein